MSRKIDDTNSRGGICGADFWVRDVLNFGIQGGCVVDERKEFDSGSIDLPKSDPLSIGAELKTVVQRKFFLIGPVERAFDFRRRVGGCKLQNLLVGEILNIHISFVDVADVRGIWRKLREHQSRFRHVAAKFEKSLAGQLKDPIVASCVEPPNSARVREDQQF